jgi:hypothetical protein
MFKKVKDVDDGTTGDKQKQSKTKTMQSTIYIINHPAKIKKRETNQKFYNSLKTSSIDL